MYIFKHKKKSTMSWKLYDWTKYQNLNLKLPVGGALLGPADRAGPQENRHFRLKINVFASFEKKNRADYSNIFVLVIC